MVSHKADVGKDGVCESVVVEDNMAVGRCGAAHIALLGLGLCAALFRGETSSIDASVETLGKVCTPISVLATCCENLEVPELDSAGRALAWASGPAAQP
jgi:hypothetical protein